MRLAPNLTTSGGMKNSTAGKLVEVGRSGYLIVYPVILLSNRSKVTRKGIKNKRTIAREDARNRAIAGLPKREEAYDVLYRMMAIAEGAAAECRPLSAEQIAKGKKASPNANWDRFYQWIDTVVYCAKELANYQRPKLKAIMVAAPPDPNARDETVRVVRLTVFEGGKALPSDEAA